MRAAFVVLPLLTLTALACGRAPEATSPAGEQVAAPQPPAGAETSTVAGIRWQVPAGWTAKPGGAMRVASYAIPGDGGNPGECAVFFFGTDQGGSVESNVQRWAAQFEGSPAPTQRLREVAGLIVTEVEIAGTYLAPGGPMMQSQGALPGYRLLGAIVQAPHGNVFFKCTGPEATMTGQRAGFDALVASFART